MTHATWTTLVLPEAGGRFVPKFSVNLHVRPSLFDAFLEIMASAGRTDPSSGRRKNRTNSRFGIYDIVGYWLLGYFTVSVLGWIRDVRSAGGTPKSFQYTFYCNN